MDIIDYDLKRLSNKFPVPADCPAYLKTAKVRKMPDFNPDYLPYIGKPKWCVKCCIYGTYCDGHVCEPTLETKDDETEPLGEIV